MKSVREFKRTRVYAGTVHRTSIKHGGVSVIMETVHFLHLYCRPMSGLDRLFHVPTPVLVYFPNVTKIHSLFLVHPDENRTDRINPNEFLVGKSNKMW